METNSRKTDIKEIISEYLAYEDVAMVVEFDSSSVVFLSIIENNKGGNRSFSVARVDVERNGNRYELIVHQNSLAELYKQMASRRPNVAPGLWPDKIRKVWV